LRRFDGKTSAAAATPAQTCAGREQLEMKIAVPSTGRPRRKIFAFVNAALDKLPRFDSNQN
jgi:hypothetical protein